jgi:4-amino-4-deoxy-L-arabinose transferase-like glycosyltransferase
MVLVAAAIATYMTAARDEDFWWADGASFALNGEFVRDYLASGLGQNPVVFAQEWFRHYPALTISLYPPIFPLVEAAAFAIFGFSHTTALATVTVFATVASIGIYRTVRTTASVLPATAAGIMLLATPEVLRWSREIVMDVPAMALLLLGAAALLHYQAAKRPGTLLVTVLLTLAAVYTKQTAIFVVPAFAVSLLADDGWALARCKSTWLAVSGFLIGLLPLAVFTLLYGTENFHIAFGEGTGQKGYGRLSVQALMAYGRVLPEIVGIIPLVGSGAYLALLGVKGWHDNAERRLTVLMVSWFVIDYLLISVTADFETRYAVPLTAPPVVLSILLIARVLSTSLAGGVALVASVWMFAAQISSQPVMRVEGYGDVAQYVLEQSEPGDVVLFHGMASKNFAFSLRTRSPTPKVSVLRAEKFLVDYTIMRDWGITDRNLSAADVEAIIDRYEVSFIVFQPNFWTDQPSIAALQRVIDSDRFRMVAQFGITSEDLSRRATLRVYRNIRRTAISDQARQPVRPE